MTIEVYPSKLEGEPLERHETYTRMSVAAWLSANVPGYEFRESPPISVTLNGGLVAPEGWADTEFSPGDVVRIYPEAKGLEIATIALIVAGVAVAAAILLQPSIPKQRNQQNAGGSNLDEASIKGNKIKINSPIREIAGTRPVYPDYLIPLHRYFESPRAQVVETHLCIGKGKMVVPASRVLVGDTPLISLGDDASYQIYEPGESVAADPRAVWWHSATEVGATSTGTAGLELTVSSSAEPVADASSYILSGDSITIPSGAGSFPDSWESGMIVRIEAPYNYTVTDGVGVGVRDVISGDIEQLGLVAGDLIEIVGDNEGLYIVDTVDNMAGTLTLNYSNGDPATGLVIGAMRATIGPRGLRYRITAAAEYTISLERLTSTGATDEDWLGFTDATIGDAIIALDESSLEGGFSGPFAACPEGEVTNTIEVDVFFPGGLIYIGKDGWIAPPFYPEGALVTVDIQYRDIATSGDWVSVTDQYSNNTQDQLGYTKVINLPSAFRPEVRLRRIGAKSTNPSVQDTVQWYGLRSKLVAPTSYAGATTMTVKLRGGGKIAAQSEQLVRVDATRILPVRENGVELGEQPTRSIAAWVRHVAKTIGYTDDDLDLDELDRLGAIWDARGDYYDNATAQSSTAKGEINNALRAGFAEMTIDRGKIKPARDEPRAAFDHMYTPQNMTGPMTREFTALSGDDFDGVDVEYTDSRTWQVETVQCRLPGDLGLRVETMQVEGVVNRTKAWRIGMRRRRSHAYRRYAHKFDTEWDALNSSYLSYVACGDDVPGYGQSAILYGIATMGAGHLLVSSEPLDWSAGGVHVVALRKPDGRLSGPYTATRVDDYRLTIPGPLDFVPDLSLTIEPPHLLFGPVTRWNYPTLITEISPSGGMGVSVSGVNYDPRVYSDDDNAPD
jgi:hypothetical protein